MLDSLFPMSRSWDTVTFLLYVAISIIVVNLCKIGAVYESQSVSKHSALHKTSNLCYFIAFIILVLLATLRNEYVGSDTPVYVRDFMSATMYHFNYNNILSFNQSEPGFQLLLYVVRRFTDNYHVLFFICYSLIAGSYIKFIKYFYDEKSDYIFLQIFIFFYVSNMSGLRSALGMVFLLPSFMALAEKKYLKSVILTVLAACFHYTMIFNIIIIGLSWVVSNPVINRRRWILPAAIIGAMITSYGAVSVLNGLLSVTKYAFYKTDVEQLSLLGSAFYIIFAVLIFINYRRLLNRIEQKPILKGIMNCCISFLITYPVIFLTAAYRIPNYYALPRLTIWSELEKCYEENVTKNSIILFRFLCQIVIILYLLYRFTRMAENGNFMYQM